MKKAYTDGELVRNLQCGDETAFDELYERYHKLVYFIAYEMCRNDADAKDILQETFLQVKKSIVEMKEPDNFKPWLNRITVNKCKNLFRSRKTVELDEDNAWFKNHMQEERMYMLPEAKLHFENDQDLIHQLMNHLSDAQREVLVLRYFHQMSMKEMAEILGVAEGTIKTRLMYAKNNLKKLVEKYEAETGTKVNFHVADGALVSLFAYAYQNATQPLVGKYHRKQQRKSFHPSSTMMFHAACASLVGVVSVAGIKAYQEYRSLDTTPMVEQGSLKQKKEDEGNAKELYFQLMDWACCEDDMKIKTKEQFEEIMPLYNDMTSTPSQYLERLKQEHWIEYFNQVYEGF